jgi:hypothetical protein
VREQSKPWAVGDRIDAPCPHAEPQTATQLHGVCIFCWRDRCGALERSRSIPALKLAAYRAGKEAAAKACDEVSADYYPHAKGAYNHCMSAIRALPDPTPETLEQIK